jgi:hypothetical protein
MPFIDPGDLAGLKNATRAGHSAVSLTIGKLKLIVFFGAVAVLLARMAFKKEFFESQTLGSMALLVAFYSAIFGWVFIRLPKTPRWTLVLTVPIILAYCSFRGPSWLGAHPSRYDSNSILTFFIWAGSGLAASAATVVLSAKLRDPTKV